MLERTLKIIGKILKFLINLFIICSFPKERFTFNLSSLLTVQIYLEMDNYSLNEFVVIRTSDFSVRQSRL